uniref:Uncharacterized protein n=1 Tax=Setaria italica TaxID=4555 RepID=K3YBF5_SETIT
MVEVCFCHLIISACFLQFCWYQLALDHLNLSVSNIPLQKMILCCSNLTFLFCYTDQIARIRIQADDHTDC